MTGKTLLKAENIVHSYGEQTFLDLDRFYLYDILNEISEIRTSCGFRENMKQVANKPCDVVALEWPICLHLESMIQDVMKERKLALLE